MAIVKDKDHQQKLATVIGPRLRAARRACQLKEADAAKAIGHEKLTQISLAESGIRLLPMHSMVKLAELYGVSLDYLTGRLDDPSADPMETSAGVVAASVGTALRESVQVFVVAMQHQAQASLMQRRADHDQLKEAVRVAYDIGDALERFRELNPNFDEDMRGGQRLLMSVSRIMELARTAQRRHDHEREISQGLAEEAAAALMNPDQLPLLAS